METIVTLAVLGCGAAWLGRKVLASMMQPQVQSPLQLDIDRRVREAAGRERDRRQRLLTLQHKLRTALLQLHQAPDFRRAANWAGHAKELPTSTRLRLFRAFWPRLLRHFISRLQLGGDPNVLVESLRDLVGHLGAARFEADYIQAEAERLVHRSAQGVPSYERRLHDLQREHESRLTVLRNSPSIDRDTREQLIEAEGTRFREQVLDVGSGE